MPLWSHTHKVGFGPTLHSWACKHAYGFSCVCLTTHMFLANVGHGCFGQASMLRHAWGVEGNDPDSLTDLDAESQSLLPLQHTLTWVFHLDKLHCHSDMQKVCMDFSADVQFQCNQWEAPLMRFLVGGELQLDVGSTSWFHIGWVNVSKNRPTDI